ncbi:hypothetical protein T05_6678 [Trichinella murrelli]|uniref:Uncharacterized protein n=1 Tax=Trichinella murrelli TaxID=144512 RepID=A0A0V0UEJ7_9BILA|nr:hypothetical protein T05_6678 [Trichinella murrelli]
MYFDDLVMSCDEESEFCDSAIINGLVTSRHAPNVELNVERSKTIISDEYTWENQISKMRKNGCCFKATYGVNGKITVLQKF